MSCGLAAADPDHRAFLCVSVYRPGHVVLHRDLAGADLVLAAYAEESIWAGIAALPRGQSEAARSTGLS
jgi:ABC-type amino acid transport system permease subunit